MSYYISPRFLDKLAVHITKNYLDLPGVRVPLLLGVHGRKGEGKSFQCELVFEKMGIEAVHMSAGELESPDAGDPARLIRLRYREAAEFIKVRGKMCVLMINDLDAGAGRMDKGTQYTVNTQMVNGTLMNIADNPTDVQLPGSYDSTPLHRVPIIVTGNDLSTLYAPLIRDGRMDKFFWEPNREEKIGIVKGIFAEDNLPSKDIEQLVDTFPNQAVDFFSALRSRIYDEQIRQFIHDIGFDRVSVRVVNSVDGPPEFPKPNFKLPRLIEFGNVMRQEQQRVEDMKLSQEYNHSSQFGDVGGGDSSRVTSPVPQESYKAVTRNELANEPTKSHNPDKVKGSGSSNGHAKLSSEVLEQVENLLSGGYHIGVEYVDRRRFRTNSWKSCPTISDTDRRQAIAAVESCLAEHSGDYIRLIGIDPKAKRRVMEKIIQRPDV